MSARTYEYIAIALITIVLMLLSCAKGVQMMRDSWCDVKFAEARSAADTLAVVRDSLPPGCDLKGKP